MVSPAPERNVGPVSRGRQTEALAASSKNGTGGAEQTYRTFAGVAVKTGARKTVSDAANTFADCIGIQRGTGSFFQ